MNNKKSIIKYALANGLWTALYVFIIGFLFNSAGHIFGNTPDNTLMPVAFLLLFMISATITGGLVLGRPLLWYLDGKKKDALKLFGYTLFVLILVMTLVVITLYFNK